MAPVQMILVRNVDIDGVVLVVLLYAVVEFNLICSMRSGGNWKSEQVGKMILRFSRRGQVAVRVLVHLLLN